MAGSLILSSKRNIQGIEYADKTSAVHFRMRQLWLEKNRGTAERLPAAGGVVCDVSEVRG
jgi:hypothetical protein